MPRIGLSYNFYTILLDCEGRVWHEAKRAKYPTVDSSCYFLFDVDERLPFPRDLLFGRGDFPLEFPPSEALPLPRPPLFLPLDFLDCLGVFWLEG